MKKYIINRNTLAVIGINFKSCKIVEKEDEFVILRSWQEVINDSCLYYGSSFQGRLEGSRTILNRDYKVPVVINEVDKLIFFSVGNLTDYRCSWVSLKNLNYYSFENGKISFNFQG